jgi:hypothetical protein
VPTNPQIQCSVLLACTRAATIESKQQVSQYRQALPSDTSYHNSAQCRMLCRVLSSTTQSHSLYSQSPKQAASQHLAPPQSRAGGDPLHSVGGPMLACTGWPPPRKSSRYALLWLWVQDCPSQPSQNSPSLMTTLLALVEGQLRAPRGISKPCPGRPAQRSDSMPHPGGQRTLAHGLGAMTCSSPWLRPSPR